MRTWCSCLFVTVVLLQGNGYGADPSPPVTAPQTEPRTEAEAAPPRAVEPPADAKPDAWLEYMEALMIIAPPDEKPESIRKELLAAFAKILNASQKVLRHPDSTPVHKAQAHTYECSVLYQGARAGLPTFADLLEKQARQLRAAEPKSELAALASVMAIKARHESDDGLEPTAMPAVEQYMKDFPGDEGAIDLLQELALTAELAGKLEPARQAYSLIQQHFPKHETGQAVPAMLRRLELVGNSIQVSGPTLDGKKYSLTDYTGKVVLVDFWASWCPPCIVEMPQVREVYTKYHAQGFEIVGIPLDEDEETLRFFVNKMEMTWPQIFHKETEKRGFDHPIAVHYGMNAIPMFFLIDRQGKVISTTVRSTNLEQKVKEALAK